ncbi:MAG TPA: hypothetical protein VGH43_10600 [Jatrophihabitans sp.]
MPYRFLPDAELTGLFARETITASVGKDDYILDIGALTSNYRCIYGQGCQGTTPLVGERPGQHRPADLSVTGCCRTSPGYGRAIAEADDPEQPAATAGDTPLRVQPYVDQLRPDEAQHYERIAAGEWLEESERPDGLWDSRHATVSGNCIFLNTEMPNGKTGCALWHVAMRLGDDPKNARPYVCHSAPAAAFGAGVTADGTGERVFVTLRPHWFGWFAPEGYFCTDDPAAYSAGEPVFRRMSSEYSTLLGAEVYAALLPTLEQAWAERGERLRAAWGTPTDLGRPPWERSPQPIQLVSTTAEGGDGDRAE